MPRYQRDSRVARAILSAPYPLPLTIPDRYDDMSPSPKLLVAPQPSPSRPSKQSLCPPFVNTRVFFPPPPTSQHSAFGRYRDYFPVFPFPVNSGGVNETSHATQPLLPHYRSPVVSSLIRRAVVGEDEAMTGIEDSQREQRDQEVAKAALLSSASVLRAMFPIRLLQEASKASEKPLPPSPVPPPPPLPAVNTTTPQGSTIANVYPSPEALTSRSDSQSFSEAHSHSSLPDVCTNDSDGEADEESLYQVSTDSISFATSSTTKTVRRPRRPHRMFIGGSGLTPFTYAPVIASRHRRLSQSSNSTAIFSNGFVSEIDSTRTITRVPRRSRVRVRRSDEMGMRPRGLKYRSSLWKKYEYQSSDQSVTPKARPPALARHHPPPATLKNTARHGPRGRSEKINDDSSNHHHHSSSWNQSMLNKGDGVVAYKGKEKVSNDENVLSDGQKTPTPPRRFDQTLAYPISTPRTPTPMPMSLDPEEFSWPRPLSPRESAPLGVPSYPDLSYAFSDHNSQQQQQQHQIQPQQYQYQVQFQKQTNPMYSFVPLQVPFLPSYSFPTSDAISTDPDPDGDIDFDINTSTSDVASFTGGFDSSYTQNGLNSDSFTQQDYIRPQLSPPPPQPSLFERIERVDLPLAKACHNFLLVRQMQESRRRHLARVHGRRMRDAPGLCGLERVVHGMTAAADAIARAKEPAPYRPAPMKNRNHSTSGCGTAPYSINAQAHTSSPHHGGYNVAIGGEGASSNCNVGGNGDIEKRGEASVWPTPPTPPRHTISIRSLASIAHVDESKPSRKRRRSLSPSSAYNVTTCASIYSGKAQTDVTLPPQQVERDLEAREQAYSRGNFGNLNMDDFGDPGSNQRRNSHGDYPIKSDGHQTPRHNQNHNHTYSHQAQAEAQQAQGHGHEYGYSHHSQRHRRSNSDNKYNEQKELLPPIQIYSLVRGSGRRGGGGRGGDSNENKGVGGYLGFADASELARMINEGRGAEFSWTVSALGRRT